VTTRATPRPYSPEEDAILRDLVGRCQWQVVVAALPGRSLDGVKQRAITLGLFDFGGGETTAHETAVRRATIQLGQKIREVARRRGIPLPAGTYREGAGA
jgi:hypothetical protein